MRQFLTRYIGWMALSAASLFLLLVGVCTWAFPAVVVFWRGLLVAGCILLVYNIVAMLLCKRLSRSKPEHLVTFYLVNKMLRLFVSIAMLLLYFFASGSGSKVAFAVIFFLFYLLFVGMESFFMVRMETKATKV